MRIFRIVKERHQASRFSGEGARRYGGRWNSRGTAIGYACSSFSLAVLEILVHTDSDILPRDYVLVEAELADADVEHLDPTALPATWRDIPPHHATAQIGDHWVQGGRGVALTVPSAIIGVHDEVNVLINPSHPRFSSITTLSTRPFALDPRLRRP